MSKHLVTSLRKPFYYHMNE